MRRDQLAGTGSDPRAEATNLLGVLVTPTGPDALRRESDDQISALADRFEQILRAGDGVGAELLTAEAIDAGVAPEVIQSLVITPAMVRVGELWERGQLGVADEHLATAICQHALLKLFESMSDARRRLPSAETILLAAVEGQHHVLGLKMCADVLESYGHPILYLGADVPVASLRAFALKTQPALAGLGFGITSNVSCLADSIWALHEVSPNTRILLGGRSIPAEFRSTYRYVENSIDVRQTVKELLEGPPQPLPRIVEVLRSNISLVSWDVEHPGEIDPVAERMSLATEQAVDLAREHFRRSQAYRELAFRDPLTGLANRRAFADELDSVTHKGGAHAAVMMIDVDNFKTVNDTRGHDAGDELLRAIAETISESLRPNDVAARMGGDEFAILLPATTIERACEIAERVRAAVADSSSLPVSLSIGVSPLAKDSRVAVLAADTALYRAKAAGRNCVMASSQTKIA